MGRPSKRNSLRSHARRRCAQRHGIVLDENRRRRIITAIQAGRARFIERQSNRITVWSVPYDDGALRVVYDKRHEIVTVLPPDKENEHE